MVKNVNKRMVKGAHGETRRAAFKATFERVVDARFSQYLRNQASQSISVDYVFKLNNVPLL